MAESLPLKALLDFTRDGEWGKGEPSDDLVEMAVIRGTDFLSVRQGDISTVPRRFIPRKAAERKTLMPGDILLETAGGTKDQPTGRTVYLSARIFEALPVPVTCASFSRFLRVNRELVDPQYLFWYLQSIYSTGDILPYHIQHTGVARFQYTDFASQWQVPLPPLEEQAEIADTLSMFDDKIELNRRMNETLEAMARAIFTDWFVDFGPTRAKAEGRAPYLAPELWDLFPDALDDEDTPVGWESKPLDEIAEFLNGLALQKFPGSHSEDSLPIIKIAELRGGIAPKSNRASRDVPKKYVVADGDFLFSWSGSLLAKFWTEGEGALNQHLFKVTSDRYPAWFFSQWVHHHLEEFQAIAASKATTMGHIQRRHLKEAKTTCPPDDVLSILGQTVGPLVERTIKNELEARTLSQTRDLLLPKLMSGAICLREAEKAVEVEA